MHIILLFLLIVNFSIEANEAKLKYKEAGKNLALENSKEALNQIKHFNTKDLKPVFTKEEFNTDEVLKQVHEKQTPDNETYKFLTSSKVLDHQKKTSYHEDEDFIKNSESIFSSQQTQNIENDNALTEKQKYTIEICQQEGDPFLVSYTRTLTVPITSNPLKKIKVKVCKGHCKEEKHQLEKKAKKAVKKLNKEFENDELIEWHKEDYDDPGFGHRYVVWAKWKHRDDTQSCDHYKTEERSSDQSIYQEGEDQWIIDQPDVAQVVKNPNYTLVAKQCVDATQSKWIDGHEIYRPCWQEKFIYFFQYPKSFQCDVLKKKSCRQIAQQCLHVTEQGCALWEKTFECIDQIYRDYEIQNLEEDTQQTIEYSPNQSFADVYSRLAIFEEVKKEVEFAKTSDATTIELFKGKRMVCSKSVADHLIYDCCFEFKGLAKQVGLTYCSAEELGLAEMREKRLCHLVGHYDEKFLDLWKSRDNYVYCAYPTKMARIIQEQGREQLKLSWGNPETTQCEGLTIDQLAKLDLTKMNLEELLEDVPAMQTENLEERLDTFRERLKNNIEKSEYKR